MSAIATSPRWVVEYSGMVRARSGCGKGWQASGGGWYVCERRRGHDGACQCGAGESRNARPVTT